MASPSPPTRRLKSLDLTSSPPPASPSSEEPQSPTLPINPESQPQARDQEPPLTAEQREALLQRELSLLKTMNTTLNNLHTTLSVSKNNLKTLQTTISSSAVLLETWTRILSQAEHNARLIADPSWEGASEDAVAAEREESERKARIEREREEKEQRERERVVGVENVGEKVAGQGGRGLGRGLRGSGGRRTVGRVGRIGAYRGRARG